jgi:MoxR-like ATPase
MTEEENGMQLKKKNHKPHIESKWDLVEAVVQLSPRVLLHGPTGTGKTHVANHSGNPTSVYNVTATEDTPAAEFRGHFVPKDGNFLWMDGPVVRAMRAGSRLVVNEIDQSSGDLLTFFYAVLDDPGMAAVTLPTGEVVRPGEGFSVVGTMNGSPKSLPAPLRDRFAVSIYINEPHPKAVELLPPHLRDFARNGTAAPDEDRRTSVRALAEFTVLSKRIGEKHAAEAIFGKRAQTVLNALKAAS